MLDEKEMNIAWQVTLKEAGDTVRGMPWADGVTPVEMGAAIVDCAAEIWAWRLKASMAGLPPTPAPPPRPAQPPVRAVEGQRPPETPYGEEEPPHPAAQEAPPVERPVQERCLCGSLMTFHPDKGSNGAWFCPEKTPSRYKAIQDEQAALHPPIWLDA